MGMRIGNERGRRSEGSDRGMNWQYQTRLGRRGSARFRLGHVDRRREESAMIQRQTIEQRCSLNLFES